MRTSEAFEGLEKAALVAKIRYRGGEFAEAPNALAFIAADRGEPWERLTKKLEAHEISPLDYYQQGLVLVMGFMDDQNTRRYRTLVEKAILGDKWVK